MIPFCKYEFAFTAKYNFWLLPKASQDCSIDFFGKIHDSRLCYDQTIGMQPIPSQQSLKFFYENPFLRLCKLQSGAAVVFSGENLLVLAEYTRHVQPITDRKKCEASDTSGSVVAQRQASG